jgi:hypothetical protein
MEIVVLELGGTYVGQEVRVRVEPAYAEWCVKMGLPELAGCAPRATESASRARR